MERRRIASFMLTVLAIGASVVLPAFAKNRQRVTIFTEENVGSTKLAAGEYLMKWETHSPEATVTFVKDGKVMYQLTGKVVEHEKKFQNNVVVDNPGPDGSRQLVEMELGGTRKSIVFGQS